MRTVPTIETPMFLQAAQWLFDPLNYLTANFKRYGDIFKTHGMLLGDNSPVVVISDPSAIQYLLTHDSGKELSAPGDAYELMVPIVGRQNTPLASGNEHRRRRKLLMPPFHAERVKAYAQSIQQITQEALAQSLADKFVDVRKLMGKITMRMILQTVFGMHSGECYENLERLYTHRLDMISTPWSSIFFYLPWIQNDFGSWSLGHSFHKLTKEIDQILFTNIQERRTHPNPDRSDILSLLLCAKDEDGHGLTDQDLRDELMALMMGGYETTATSLTWAIYWIYSLPDVKEKLLTELNTVATQTDPTKFMSLPYLNAVCNEAMRLYPPLILTLPRRVEKPLELCGYQLEPGTLIMGSIYLIHHREELYPQPHKFSPERFLERQFSNYEFLPFGGGVRRCIGAALAHAEMRIALGTILTQFDLSLINDRPIVPARRGIGLAPSTSVQINIKNMQQIPAMCN
ncbi:cytochrome P450 [Calothrix sp. UHCC 0171]|uniref:cytochrome P450 n=1 Tax=Calothrix sp. UHCC 0171 TaxID=3110245 RepID=UPI002B1EA483|nr:cytochrome P450 [Calothrix sp. UHCC 0171]MEA5574649.1 cytochrome P450 [Calothrix sp. UHCC 0171]